MKLLPLAVLAATALHSAALAQKYHLGDAETKKRVEAGAPADVIEGVLIAEDATHYHVRIVGGEVWLPKSRVYQVEQGGPTLAAVTQEEKDRAEALAAADRERQQEQARAMEAAAQERGRATEAGLDRGTRGTAEPVVAPSELEVYDPVVGRLLTPDRTMTDAQLQHDLQLAFENTGDRRFLKLLRQVRRMR